MNHRVNSITFGNPSIHPEIIKNFNKAYLKLSGSASVPPPSMDPYSAYEPSALHGVFNTFGAHRSEYVHYRSRDVLK